MHETCDHIAMRVPDILTSCVAFLAVESESGLSYRGTAFLVGVAHGSGDGRGWQYLVTARHNVEHAYEQYGHLLMRCNLTGEGAALFELPNDWLLPENSADVAVLRSFRDMSDLDLYPVSQRLFVKREAVEEGRVGFGDDIVVTGLFTESFGRMRNSPIVRSGSIAAIPSDDLVDQASGAEYRGYLVELTSFGGLSGSPVFVRSNERVSEAESTNYSLLGLIKGHWDYRGVGPVLLERSEAAATNMGIAIVTPVDEVLSILYDPDEIKFRRRREAQRSDERGRATVPSP